MCTIYLGGKVWTWELIHKYTLSSLMLAVLVYNIYEVGDDFGSWELKPFMELFTT